MKNVLKAARTAFLKKNSGRKIRSFFKGHKSKSSDTGDNGQGSSARTELQLSVNEGGVSKPEPPTNVVHPVATILYACASETPLWRIG